MMPDADTSRSRIYLDTWVLAGLVLGMRRDRGDFKRILS